MLRVVRYIFIMLMFGFINLQSKSFTLNDMLNEVILTDPQINEYLHQYRSVVQEAKVSRSGYLPKLDLYGKIGRMDERGDEDDKYTSSEMSLKLTQNLFDGFSTRASQLRDNARARAAYKKYMEVAQKKLYEAIEAYIGVIEYAQILAIAKDNVRVHEETLVRIKRRYDKGYSTLSEVDRVRGRVALSRSNYIAQTNNLYDARIKFQKALGKSIDAKDLVKPIFRLKLPSTLEEATKIAIKNNPSMQVANLDIDASKQSLRYAKKGRYPKLDVELKGSRYSDRYSSEDGDEKELSAMLVLNYNLYNGNSDEAVTQKYISLLNAQYAHKNKLKRDLLESLGLSWSAYKLLQQQQIYQQRYKNLTQKSQRAYSKEFQLGRRTLIDLLDIQDELNNVRIKVIHNDYDLLFAKYRVAEAMGKLFDVIRYKFDMQNDEDSEDEDITYEKYDKSRSKIQKYKKVQVERVKYNKTIKEDGKNELDDSNVKKLWKSDK